MKNAWIERSSCNQIGIMRYSYKMRRSLTLFFACIFISSVAQTATYSLQLFYNINESFSLSNFSRLDSFCAALPEGPAKFTITGYADFLHSDQYNLGLSQKRADLIKGHLLQKQHARQFTVLKCTGLGESASANNGSGSGEPAQRRVDLTVELQGISNASTAVQKTGQPLVTPQEVKPAASLETLKAGERLELTGLSFVPGRHFVVKSSMPVLEKLLKTLKDNPAIKIEIQGHVCCSIGPADSYDADVRDYRLSEHRAKSVYDYLVKNGISENRLGHKGFGHSQPKVEELSAEDEQINRRVEVMVTEN